MTHYQSVFNGYKMVYRKVEKKQQGKGAVKEATVIQAPPVEQKAEVRKEPKVEKKALRAALLRDIMNMK